MMDLLSLSQIPPPAVSVMQLLLLVYMGIEVVFYFVFHFYLVPKANQPVPAAPYRDYGDFGERHQLLYRIFNRVRHGAEKSNLPVREALADFLLSWFDEAHKEEPKVKLTATAKAKLLERSKSFPCPYKGEPAPPAILLRGLSTATGYSSSSRTSSEDGSITEDLDLSCGGDADASSVDPDVDELEQMTTTSNVKKGKWMMEGLWQENVGVFFAWAIFGKSYHELEEWEVEEIELCKNMMEEEFDLVFPHDLNNLSPSLECVRGPKASPPPSKNGRRQPVLDPRLLNVENCRSLHRPLAVYLGVIIMKWIGGMFLRLLGFQRMVLNGVITWYRPSPKGQEKLQPLIFFHGIAPGGFVFYLPMLFAGLVKGDGQRAMAIFLNPSITCDINFKGITEGQMVAAVEEFIETYLDKGKTEKQQFAVAGHSFGSVPITWLVHSSLRDRIGQILLLDPVTILLSDSAIVGNFLYAKGWNYIRVLTSSELFTEHYLRRQFAWYNADLWLEDLPANVPVTICLSGSDQIVDAPAVRKLILQYKQDHHSDEKKKKKNDNINLIYWEGAAHAFCVAYPFKWPQMRKVLLEQELASLQQRRQQKKDASYGTFTRVKNLPMCMD